MGQRLSPNHVTGNPQLRMNKYARHGPAIRPPQFISRKTPAAGESPAASALYFRKLSKFMVFRI